MTQGEMKRREFLKTVGGTAAALAVAGPAAAAAPSVRVGRVVPADQKLNVACVGVGGMGGADVGGVSGENIVALCDVDLARARGSFNRFPNAKRYKDFRKMLIEMDDQIDAVTVSTPDHMHFPIAMMAMEMGKHVRVQKPMAHSVWEARQMTLAARKHKVATQMGIQAHSGEGIRLMREWIEAGAVGPVREVHLWTNRAIWPQGIDRPTDTHPVPDTLDWNLWLGTAPERPYNPAYAPFKWRGWWDFGCGALGDIACHMMDASYWSLDLGFPETIVAETSPVNDETAPKWSIITYQFPARGAMPPVKVVWHDGGKMPARPDDLEEDRKLLGGIGGQLIVGDKGKIMADCYCSSPRLIPESKMQAFERPPKKYPRSPGTYNEWIGACKGGPPAGANFDYSGPFTEMIMLGNLAIRSGKLIKWDKDRLRCTNAPEANKYVRHPYRVF
jgi:predicted dehydrogenase